MIKKNCIDFNCTIEDIIVVIRSCQRVIENNFYNYMCMMYGYLPNEKCECQLEEEISVYYKV